MNRELKRAYATLGIEPDATEKDVRKAYARLAKATRPDTDPDGFTSVRNAYEQALRHVKSTAKVNKPENKLNPTIEDAPSEQLLTGVSPSESGLDHLLDTAPQFETNEPAQKNRFEQLDQLSYQDDFQDARDSENNNDNSHNNDQSNEHANENKHEHERKHDQGFDTNKPFTEAQTSAESTVADNHQRSSANNLKTTDPATTEFKEKTPEASIIQSSSILTPHRDINHREEDAFEQESVNKIQQLLVQSQRLLGEQSTYNETINEELNVITDEIITLSADLKIGTRDDALEQLANQIINHTSAPFGFVENVSEQLELTDTVLPNSVQYWKLGLQERYYSMRDVYNFEQRSHEQDNFIAYFIHGKPKPFRFTGFPNKRDVKLYQIYADMLNSAWPPRPDLIHPKAQLIIDKADPLEEDAADDAPDPPFDKEQIRYFVKILLWIMWIGFMLNLLFSNIIPTRKSEMLEDVMNPSDELKSRIEALKSKDQSGGDQQNPETDTKTIQQRLEELGRHRVDQQ